MTLREFLKEHKDAKIEVYEYGRPLAMFNNEKIKDYEKSIRADGIREFARYLVIDGYIRYGFETDYLVNQFLKKEQNNDY